MESGVAGAKYTSQESSSVADPESTSALVDEVRALDAMRSCL